MKTQQEADSFRSLPRSFRSVEVPPLPLSYVFVWLSQFLVCPCICLLAISPHLLLSPFTYFWDSVSANFTCFCCCCFTFSCGHHFGIGSAAVVLLLLFWCWLLDGTVLPLGLHACDDRVVTQYHLTKVKSNLRSTCHQDLNLGLHSLLLLDGTVLPLTQTCVYTNSNIALALTPVVEHPIFLIGPEQFRKFKKKLVWPTLH